MPQFHYPLPPESEPTSSFSGLSDEARAALSHVAIGPSAADQLLKPDGQTIVDIDPSFEEGAVLARIKTRDLLTVTKPDLLVPELDSPELANVNWVKLQEGYRTLEQFGYQPELVISPEGQSLSFWEDLYSLLRIWQGEYMSGVNHRLKKQSYGDGLYVDDQVKAHWAELTPIQPRWGVSVIPTVAKAPVLKVDYYGKDANGQVPVKLQNLLREISSTEDSDRHHPVLERYLTLQATRLQRDHEPLDSHTYSWLNGTFTNSDNQQAAPRGRWSPDSGRVRLGWDRVGYRFGGLGARPEVRG